MMIDIEAGRALIAEVNAAREEANIGDWYTGFDKLAVALQEALDEVVRLTNMMHAVHMTLNCRHLRCGYDTRPPGGENE